MSLHLAMLFVACLGLCFLTCGICYNIHWLCEYLFKSQFTVKRKRQLAYLMCTGFWFFLFAILLNVSANRGDATIWTIVLSLSVLCCAPGLRELYRDGGWVRCPVVLERTEFWWLKQVCYVSKVQFLCYFVIIFVKGGIYFLTDLEFLAQLIFLIWFVCLSISHQFKTNILEYYSMIPVLGTMGGINLIMGLCLEVVAMGGSMWLTGVVSISIIVVFYDLAFLLVQPVEIPEYKHNPLILH